VIEVQVDVERVDILHWEGFPQDTVDEDIYEALMGQVQVFEPPTAVVRYLMAIALFLMTNYESSPWRVIGVIDQVEVARMEYSITGWTAPSVPAPRVSRYQREPVI
jgi:hypothetical protein